MWVKRWANLLNWAYRFQILSKKILLKKEVTILTSILLFTLPTFLNFGKRPKKNLGQFPTPHLSLLLLLSSSLPTHISSLLISFCLCSYLLLLILPCFRSPPSTLLKVHFFLRQYVQQKCDFVLYQCTIELHFLCV